MDRIVAQIEKAQPFFTKLSRNKYLRAIRDGFVANMSIVLFSSIFMLVAYIPNIFGFYWSDEVLAAIVKPYSYSMGLLGLLVAATTAKSLTDAFNRELAVDKQIGVVSTMVASIVAFLLLSADPIEGGLSTSYSGTTGLLSAFVAAFLTANIYKFFISKGITIKMPEEVPPNIAQAFADLFPFATAVMVSYGLDILIRHLSGVNFAQAVIEMFQPLFHAADGYLGLAIIYGAMAFFWFIGIHGPSIVEPAISAIAFLNMDLNLELLQAGKHASHAITPGLQYFVATFGGTGATFVVPFIFMWAAKSKRNKAVGRAAVVPTSFGVNEPILFGGPLVLNPIFFVPFILAPIANVWIFKAFVDIFGMNSFMYFLPWPTPGPIGIVMGTGFAPLSFILAALLIVVDVLIYYPFFKVYDHQTLLEEVANIQEHKTEEEHTEVQEVVVEASKELSESKSVLVLCAGGGTSALLRNALNKAAKEKGIDLVAAADSYGEHYDIMANFDAIILAPQVASNYEDIKRDTDRHGIELIMTEGQEYIDLTMNPEKALEFVIKKLGD